MSDGKENNKIEYITLGHLCSGIEEKCERGCRSYWRLANNGQKENFFEQKEIKYPKLLTRLKHKCTNEMFNLF